MKTGSRPALVHGSYIPTSDLHKEIRAPEVGGKNECKYTGKRYISSFLIILQNNYMSKQHSINGIYKICKSKMYDNNPKDAREDFGIMLL